METQFILIIFVSVFLLQLGAFLGLELLNRAHGERTGDTVPEPFRGFIDDEKLRQMQAYSSERSRLGCIEKPILDAVLLVLILTGGVSSLAAAAQGLVHNYVASGILFFASIGAIFFILGLPFEYYSTFVLEERFGFNRSTPGTWIADKAKEVLLSAVLLVVLAGPILWIIDRFPQWWWLWGLIATSVIQFVLVVLYPILIAPLFNRFEPLKDEDLAEQVKQMVLQVGMKVNGIFQMDAGKRSTHANAYFTGLGRTKRIVLFDTLLSSLSQDEIMAVLAHELGHFKRRHIVKSYLIGQVVLLAGFFLTYLLLNWQPLYSAFNVQPSQSYGLLLIVGVFWQRLGYFVKPLPAMLSRRFERQADAFAVSLRGTPGELVSALKKMAEHNLSNLFPHPLYVWTYYSHPPLIERIRRMESLGVKA